MTLPPSVGTTHLGHIVVRVTNNGLKEARGKVHCRVLRFRRIRQLLKIKYRYNWLRGWVQVDGIKWYVRGTDFSMSHEDWLRKEVDLTGDLFIDAGAHVGTWAVRAAKTFRRVMAFERDPIYARMLQKNAEANSLENIQIYNLALSSTSSNETRTIDSYHENPSVIKIDVEGDEYKILQGASETLKRSHPRLIVETHTPELAKSVEEFLQNDQYNIREIVKVNRWGVPQTYLICS